MPDHHQPTGFNPDNHQPTSFIPVPITLLTWPPRPPTGPTTSPSASPSTSPSTPPTQLPTAPTTAPSRSPTTAPTAPTRAPTTTPTASPTSRPTNYALLFTGSGWVSIPSNTLFPTGSSDYTIEAWIKPTMTSNAGMVGWGSYGANGGCNAVRLANAFNFRNYWWYNDVEANLQTNLANGAWHHIAATANSSMRALWLNGTRVGFDTPSPSSHVVPSPVTNARIGWTTSQEYFYGWIDEVRVWTVAQVIVTIIIIIITSISFSISIIIIIIIIIIIPHRGVKVHEHVVGDVD
jgi:hypothetical protein